MIRDAILTCARIVLQMPKRTHAKPLLEKLHWLPVEQRISYKTAVLSFKVRSTSTPAYLNRHIQTRQRARDIRSSATPALYEPFTRTNYAKRAFRCSAPAVWNSLPSTVLDYVTLSTFKPCNTFSLIIFLHQVIQCFVFFTVCLNIQVSFYQHSDVNQLAKLRLMLYRLW